MTNGLTQEELEAGFRKHWAEARSLARRSVESAWHAGQLLGEIKARLPHGDWMQWLTDEGVSESTARRIRKLASLPRHTLSDFDSVSAALKALPAPEIGHTPPPPSGTRPPPASAGPVAEGATDTTQPETAGPDAPPPAPLPDGETMRQIEHETTRERLTEAEWEITDLRERAAMQSEGQPEGGEPEGQHHPALRERLSALETDYHALREAHTKSERKLGAIRRDLLDGKGAAEILAVHFGAQAPGQTGAMDDD